MRTTARWAATLTLTATAVCGPLTGTALAATDSLYAPSALVLTVAHGDDPASAAPARAVTLSCEPAPSGTHPAPEAACAELAAVRGDLRALTARDDVMCTHQYDPVTVTVTGVWNGKRVSHERTFANGCLMSASAPALFSF